MLKQLLIKNYALIQHLEIQPSANLNVITGETGAGKSIMLGAVGLLLGNRADTRVLLNKKGKCIIEGEFDVSLYDIKSFFEGEDLDYSNDCLIRREISPSGKSRGFINDTPVNLDLMKALGIKLMDIHSQHETLLVGSHSFQILLVDSFAGCKDDFKKYTKQYQDFKNIRDAYLELQQESQQISEEADYNKFLFEELKQGILTASEVEEMEEALKLLENSEEIKRSLNEVVQLSRNENTSVNDLLRQASQTLTHLGRHADKYQKLAERVESLNIEWNDIINDIEREEISVEYNPELAEEYSEKLSGIYRLQQKHKVNDISELQNKLEELGKKVDKAYNLDDELLTAKTEMDKAQAGLLEMGKNLSQKRKKVLKPLADNLVSLIKELGIPEAQISISHQTVEAGKMGIDKISILFSANKGVAPQELKSVASGGEFSRVMFCIKYLLADKSSLPTIVFDEIDKGISGEIALKLGRMMKTMANNHQVITISHLPQIAAKADTHYSVFKDNSMEQSVSKIKLLSKNDRIEEIAKMIAGDDFSEAAIDNAKELIEK